mgnify:CR=1 FL=1
MTLQPPSICVLCLVLVSACTSVPFDYPKEASEAIPASSDTYYGSALAEWQTRNGVDMTGSPAALAEAVADAARLGTDLLHDQPGRP